MTNNKEKIMTSHTTMKIMLFTGLIMTMMITITNIDVAEAGSDDSNEKEVGVEWVNDFSDANSDPDCFSASSLTNQDSNAEGYYDTLYDEGFTKSFKYGNSAAWESDFEKSSVSGSDSSYADKVDFLYYAGHGSTTDGYPSFTFGDDEDGDNDSGYHCLVKPAEMNLGDKDLEWLTLATSYTLHNSYMSQWVSSFDDLHGMAGFHTSPVESATLGGRTACYMSGGSYGSINCSSNQKDMGDSWKTATMIEYGSSDYGAILRGVVTINSVQYDYWDEDADDMFDDPPSGGYDYFVYTKWRT